MANETKLKSLSITALQEILDACNKTFIKELGTENWYSGGTTTWSIPEVGLNYKTTDSEHLHEYLTDITGDPNIRHAYAAVNDAIEKKLSGEEEVVEANIPTESLRAQQETERAQREAAKKQIDQGKKQEVEGSIKRQQEFYEKEAKRAKQTSDALKNEKIYVEAKREESEKTEKVEKLREQAKANPQETVAQIEKTIRERIPSAPEAAAKQTAYDIVANLQTNGEPLRQTAIISALAANPEKINSVVKNGVSAKDLAEWSQVLSDSKLTGEEISRALTGAAFGDSFRREVLPQWTIGFSPNPAQGLQEFSFNRIPNDYSPLMDRQSFFLEGLNGFSVDQVKSQISLKVNSFLAGQIEKLPADSALRGVFDSKIVQACLPVAGLGVPAAWEAVEGSFFGKIAVGSGFAPALGWLGEKTGIDFGIKKITQVAVEGGVEAATGTTLAATFTAALVPFLGPLAPIVGALGAFLVEMIGAEVVNKAVGWVKDNAQKYGKFVVAGVGALFGFIIGGGSLLGATIGAGLGFGGATLISGGTSALGASVASFGSGVASVLGAIGSATLGAIGVPILATLIGFPIVVVLILFIINSGAYVVPPGASLLNSANPYIQVDKKPSVSGKQNSPVPVTYTITVTAKKDVLTGISVTNTCDAIKKGGVKIDCKSLEQIPPVPTSISPGMPFSFTFTSNYDSRFQDALVSDTFAITAKSNEGGEVSETGSASVCFGNCPLDCFAFPDNYWPKDSSVQNLKSLLTGAASTLAGQYPNFAAKVCAGGTVNLCYNPNAFNQSFFGYTPGSGACTIDFNIKSAAYGPAGVLFLLTHEVTHHIQNINGHYLVEFEDKVAPAEPSVCSYGGPNSSESMAEGDALFVGKPTIDLNGSCISNYQSQYPKHYSFARDVMFGP